jgi:hypothetical protein
MAALRHRRQHTNLRPRTASQPTKGGKCHADHATAHAWNRRKCASEDLDGVKVYNPDGKPIGHIALPERCANLTFGGVYRNRLFMAASHSLYSLYVNTQGVAGR